MRDSALPVIVNAAPANPADEWRLGEPEPRQYLPIKPTAQSDPDPSDARLERVVRLITAEDLGWFLVAAVTIVTRLIALGARPLDGAEARNALFESDLAFGSHFMAAAGPHPPWSGWVHFLAAGVSAVAGRGDCSARIVFAVAGLLLVAMAFVMRDGLGRAGALALGVLLAISPSLTYFSRSSTMVLIAATFSIVTIASFVALQRRPTLGRAAVLGSAAGLMIAADATGLVTIASFILALAILGVWELIGGDHTYLRARVWLDRYASHVAVAMIAAIVIFALSQIAVAGISFDLLKQALAPLWSKGVGRGIDAGLRYYGPASVLGEFLIVIGAIVGLALIISGRIRSRLAVWCLLWALISGGYYLLTPSRSNAFTVQIIVPMAVLGAFALGYLHHTSAWPLLRIPLGLLAVVTLYVQVVTNFVCYAPDAGEAPWARHASLFWTEGATTIQARARCVEIMKQLVPGDATVFANGAWPPALRWYLRGMRPVSDPADAAVILNPDANDARASEDHRYEFDFEESWKPRVADLDAVKALRYLMTAQVWGDVSARQIVIAVTRVNPWAPTVIMSPGAQ